MAGIAYRTFKHGGVEYIKGSAVELDDEQLAALRVAGLVVFSTEPPEDASITQADEPPKPRVKKTKAAEQ